MIHRRVALSALLTENATGQWIMLGVRRPPGQGQGGWMVFGYAGWYQEGSAATSRNLESTFEPRLRRARTFHSPRSGKTPSDPAQ